MYYASIDKMIEMKRVYFLLLSVVLFILDIVSKRWAIDELKFGETISVLPIMNFIYVENTGIAFGIFAEGGEITRWLLFAMTASISLFLLYYLLTATTTLMLLATALILGGAMGNLLDRVWYGYVIDFIDVYWGVYHWPAFNVADSVITIGAFLFAYELFILDKKMKDSTV